MAIPISLPALLAPVAVMFGLSPAKRDSTESDLAHEGDVPHRESRQLIFARRNPVKIWGIDNAERVRRLFDKQEVAKNIAADAAIWTNLDFAFDPQWMVHITAKPDTVVTVHGVPVLAHLARADVSFELAAGRCPSGLRQIEVDHAPQIYNHSLRKLETPFISRLTAESVHEIERQSYFGAYKGVTDILTKYLWPEWALVLTRAAAKIGMTPNQVTAIGAVLCVAATILFWQGSLWLGMAAALGFMVLDTVDGKLARCTITSSWWGNVFDHGIDLIHPPFWWAAWGVGLSAWGLALSPAAFAWTMVAIVGGYVVQRVIEGIFILRNGKMHIHVWERVDTQFRLITARRNPNMVILFGATVVGRPDLGLIGVAAWTMLSCLFHCVRLVQAELLRLRGAQLRSWLTASA